MGEDDIVIKKEVLYIILFHLKNYRYINTNSIELGNIITTLEERLK